MTAEPAFALLVIVLAFFGGVGFAMWQDYRSSASTNNPTGPQVVVNVPADFKPLDTLPPTQIEGARAALWWTVFDRVWDDVSTTQTAIDCADQAVETVFGPVKP